MRKLLKTEKINFRRKKSKILKVLLTIEKTITHPIMQITQMKTILVLFINSN
jgi:hypothetical protein